MQLLQFIQPVLYAIFLWWFVTGVIIVTYGRSTWVRHFAFVSATVVMLLAVGGLFLTRHQTQPAAVYLSLTCGIFIWGWQVASYYLGYITGLPHKDDFGEVLQVINQRPNSFALRFWLALRASLFHELLIIGFFVLLTVLTWNAPNKWGLWIFLALWVMHALAKLNVFFGVRNFDIKFLPPHLHHLDRLLGKRSTNPLLPLTIVVGSLFSLAHIYQGIVPYATLDQTIGFLTVGTMLGLGVIEHLLLVVPIPAMLWGWSIKILPQNNYQDAIPPINQGTRLQTVPEQIGEG